MVNRVAAACISLAAVATFSPLAARAQSSPAQAISSPQQAIGGPQVVGRFQIITTSGVAGNSFLLDTMTGTVWHFTEHLDLQGDPYAWDYVPTLTTTNDYSMFVKNNPPLPSGSSPTP